MNYSIVIAWLCLFSLINVVDGTYKKNNKLSASSADILTELYKKEFPKNILILDETMVHNANNFLDISNYFATQQIPNITQSQRPPDIEEFLNHQFPYPNVLVIKSSEIPLNLVVSGKNAIDLPIFISQIPGAAIHHIKKLDASTYSLSRFLEAFFSIHDLQDHKIFIIDELYAKNDLCSIPFELGKPALFQHVIIQSIPTPNNDTSPKKSVVFEAANNDWGTEKIAIDTPLAFEIKRISKN